MVKTISLADDAYEELSAVRRAGESFSEVARRLARKERAAALFDRGRPSPWAPGRAAQLKTELRSERDASARPRVKPGG